MPGAFHDVLFPPSISMGAVGGPRFSTTVTTLSGGTEQRNINWAQARGEWDVSHGLKTDQQVEELLAFFHARFGKAFGFRFKDWSDYRLPRWIDVPGDLAPIPVLFTTDGTTNIVQIVKVYSDLAGFYRRPITKPVVGTVQMLDNGTQTFDFTVDNTTGIITLGSTLAHTTGHQVAVVCEFNVPCRFDTDDMKLTTTMVDNFSWASIPVVETREIT
jgi:uncharacterized protein (TIGR02217 family)